MIGTKILATLIACASLSGALSAQTPLDPAKLLQQPTDTWPTYNGDYSGRRFSPLTKINKNTVNSLAPAWMYRVEGSTGQMGRLRLSATPIQVNGVLYFTVPNRAWAVDARTGTEIWVYDWESKGGSALGNRGAGISGSTLYFATTDCNLVAIDITTGKEKWHSSIGNMDFLNFGTGAPVVVRNHVLIGIGGDDLDVPGYLESHDATTGKLEWRWYAYPEPGTPEAATWPNTEAMMHGGGSTWIPGTYDPEQNLYILGTGNVQPVINGKGRLGNNLYASTIVALNPDTGKLVWYFQPNPHDTHDWDAVETPVLFDAVFKGQKRKLVAQASRNGWFFVLDRTNGKALVSAPFAKQNWTSGVDAKGQPIPSPAKMGQVNGALVAPNQGGAANWFPPSFDPQTGLFYVEAEDAYSVYYLFDDSEKPEGWAGNDRGGWAKSALRAIDYQTGKIKWAHDWATTGARSGILTTAGGLLFVGDPSTNLVAFDAANGDIVWHAGLQASVNNGPITYELDGKQYLLAAAGDTLYAFVLR
ncbi:acido-empty-quinoprotein group A [Granulicella sibirica]|uniref:Quino(Hemo)protein alcohol dehydrogenase, PQQ-dependent n=1 Tax=Granulicella sibirica TaxID=2479048 RepID=A0A4Q0SZW5_9BACT|nr:acido-empty-quinoprotein group A [Granulicella sibirica]RXH54646.1 Quino(hemo)protein alcohol dehydrogenase, PQQ-dependent [Granulicella sibirica]